MSSESLKKFSAVTSFNLKSQSYGIDMLESYFKFWPNDCILFAYLENSLNIDDEKVKDKINVLDFHKEIPEYKSFASKYFHKNNDKNYRFDALKFAHKIFAIQKETAQSDAMRTRERFYHTHSSQVSTRFCA